jgi:hypothetical protein
VEALGDLRHKLFKKGRQLAMRFGFIPKEETDEEAAARLRKEKRKRPRPSVGENRAEIPIESEDEGPTPSELEEIARFKAEVQRPKSPTVKSPKIAPGPRYWPDRDDPPEKRAMWRAERFKWNLELSTSNPQPVKWKRRDLLWEIAETGEIFSGRSLGEIVETGSILPDEAFARKDNPIVNDKRPVPGVVMITGAANEVELFVPPFHPMTHMAGKYRQSAENMAGGDAVWDHDEGGRYLYLSQADKWTFTEDPYAVGGKRGQLHSCERACGRVPHELTRWQYTVRGKWQEDEDVHVLSKYELPRIAYGVFGIYYRLAKDLNGHPAYVKVVGKKGNMLHDTRFGMNMSEEMDALPGMVQDMRSPERSPNIYTFGDVESNPATPKKAKDKDTDVVMRSLAEMPDEFTKYLYFIDVGYWVCGPQMGSTAGFMKCYVQMDGTGRGPEYLGGEDHPWYVWDPYKSDYVPSNGVLVNRVGGYEEFHCQDMTRTHMPKVEECDRLAEKFWQREKLVARQPFDAEAEAAKASFSNAGTRAVYDREMGAAASQPEKNAPKKVPAHIQAMIEANNAEKAREAGDAAAGVKCFHCWRPATSLLVRGGEKPETWGTKGGCLKCQAPRCIHCAQVDAKWVKNPDYDRIMAERKKRAKEAENAGPAGREMTYKEKKAAEKKKEEDAKRQKGENDAKLVPSKCKHCNAEIKDFWRWDRGDEDATPAFAK